MESRLDKGKSRVPREREREAARENGISWRLCQLGRHVCIFEVRAKTEERFLDAVNQGKKITGNVSGGRFERKETGKIFSKSTPLFSETAVK